MDTPMPDRPCRLQVNARGAWRNVMDFDARDGDHVMHNAPALFGIVPGVKLRIVAQDDVLQVPLATWNASQGWRTRGPARGWDDVVEEEERTA